MQTLQTWPWRQKQKSQNIISLLSSNFLIPETRTHKTRPKEEGGVCFCVHMCIWEGSTEARDYLNNDASMSKFQFEEV